ncbi:hypothetical protein [Nocardia altamirensis]|uniref:hypothetical protein n=1 Tax=Nocardia altamirensis TaxID=472158 RepID=UPI0008405792|nr:hypothetical protein [Nocardia altamirensis]
MNSKQSGDSQLSSHEAPGRESAASRLRRVTPGAVLLVAVALAGVTVALDVVVVALVHFGGAAVAFPGDTRYRGDVEFLWGVTVPALVAPVVFAAVIAALVPWLARTRGPALVALGAATVPLVGMLALLHTGLYPLMLDTTCSICDAITYDAAPGPPGYRAVRSILLALLAVCLVGAVVAASSSATTRRVRALATSTDRPPSTVSVVGMAMTVLGVCAAALSLTLILIAATARKHTYRSGFVPLPTDERAVVFMVAGLAAVFAAGTLWHAWLWRHGRGAAAAMLTLSGLGLVAGSVLVTMFLLMTPKGGVVPSGWWVEVDPPWLREVHGTVAWAALAALLVAVITVLRPATLRWVARPNH